MPKTITFTDEEFDDLVWALLMHAGECLETAADERLPQAGATPSSAATTAPGNSSTGCLPCAQRPPDGFEEPATPSRRRLTEAALMRPPLPRSLR